MLDKDKPLDPDTASSGRNADFQWAKFDPEAYFEQYYGEPHPDDDLITRLAAEAIKQALPRGDGLDVVDVGTGPNLIPFLCALPRARRLTAWEYAAVNLTWLEAELLRDDMRPQWHHFWEVVRKAYEGERSLPENPIAGVRERCVFTQGSIFDLPPRTWDAATMFFCAESITKRQDEFDAACAAFAQCLKPGGTLAAAFLVRSEGYTVSDTRFPALKLSPEAIEAAFAQHTSSLHARRIGIVEREIRSGYTGALFLTGIAL
jgi:hypothetical protein